MRSKLGAEGGGRLAVRPQCPGTRLNQIPVPFLICIHLNSLEFSVKLAETITVDWVPIDGNRARWLLESLLFTVAVNQLVDGN